MEIRLREIARKLLWANVIFSLFYKFVVEDLGAPGWISYITDVMLLLSVFFIALDRDQFAPKRQRIAHRSIAVAMLVFVSISTVSAFANSVSPVLFFWALRNTCRFFIFFICCVMVIDISDWRKFISFLTKTVVANFFIVVSQYFFLGLRDDYLNGLFGSYAGGNAVVNTVFCVVTAWLLADYFAGNRKLKKIIVPIIAMLLTSALNELKFYYIEFVAMLIIFLVLSPTNQKNLLKHLLIIIIGISIVGLSLQVFFIFYPGFSTFLSPDALYDYLFARSYNSSETLYVAGVPVMNRLSSLTIIPDYFFKDIGDQFLGLGFGSTEYSRVDLFTSSFANTYAETNYQGYSVSYILLETGFLGVLCYFSIFTIMLIVCARKVSASGPHIRASCLFGTAIAVIGFLLCFYNAALRIETSGYLFFLAMAVPFIYANGEGVASNAKDDKKSSEKHRTWRESGLKTLC